MTSSVFVFVVCLTLLQTEPSGVKRANRRPPAGPQITIYAPQPEQLEVVLDEVELDWRKEPGAKGLARGKSAVALAGMKVVEGHDVRAVVSVSGVSSLDDLQAAATTLQAANAGAEAHLVLYEPGLPKSMASRRLLTREVGLLVASGQDVRAVLEGLPVGHTREVKGVPGGYVVEAVDPIAALNLADALRQRPGVRSAYPLLRRAYTTQ